jgi:hypothetical protein
MEILSAIFLTCRDEGLCDYRAVERNKGQTSNNVRWMAVTAVCRQWRTAALNERALWNNIDFFGKNIKLTSMMLERAGPQPLNVVVHYRGGTAAQERISDVILSRTAELVLMDYMGPSTSAPHPLENPAPKLRTLRVQGYRGENAHQNYLENLPRYIFQGSAPSLYSAYFDGMSFAWRCASFLRSVRTLQVGSGDSETWSSGNSDEMLSVLHELRENLESLTIKASFVGRASLNTVLMVTLPKLRFLELELVETGDAPCTQVFLRDIRVPQIRQCSITYAVTNEELDNSFGLATEFSRRLFCDVANNGYIFDTLDLNTRCLTITGKGDLRYHLEFKPFFPTSRNPSANWVVQLCTLTDLSAISSLFLRDYGCSVVREAWPTLTPLLQGLRTVCLSQNPHPIDENAGGEDLACPSFVDADLVGYDAGEPFKFAGVQCIEANRFTYYNDLVAWAEIRSGRGCPIHEMRFERRGDVDECKLEGLRAFVGKASFWDSP